MKVKKKPCHDCGNDRMIWKNHEGKRYCKQCWSAHSVTTQPKPTAKRKALPHRSQKRVKQESEYSQKRRSFLLKHPMCEAHLLGICTQHATDIHHKAGRTGTLYLDEKYWLASCRSCHIWIENNPKEAREMGLSLSKHNQNEQEKRTT